MLHRQILSVHKGLRNITFYSLQSLAIQQSFSVYCSIFLKFQMLQVNANSVVVGYLPILSFPSLLLSQQLQVLPQIIIYIVLLPTPSSQSKPRQKLKEFILLSKVCLTQVDKSQILIVYIHYLGRTCEELLGQYVSCVGSNFKSEVDQLQISCKSDCNLDEKCYLMKCYFLSTHSGSFRVPTDSKVGMSHSQQHVMQVQQYKCTSNTRFFPHRFLIVKLGIGKGGILQEEQIELGHIPVQHANCGSDI